MTEEEIIIALRLAGKAQFIAGNEEAAASVNAVGVAADRAGLAMTRTARRGYLMNQTLFTMRRLMYGVTLGLIAGGVAALHWGFQFNDTMTSARIALLPMLGSIQAVNAELDSLFNLAKFSPFTFQDTTVAFRSMFLGMHILGISADTVNQTMQSVVDSLSAAGKSTPGALNRASVALQHMAYMGHITAQVITQLNRDGIPATAVLRKEFHLTGEEIHNVGKLGIPTLLFLQAFNRYARDNPAINGAARRQAMGSFSGLFAQFKDSMSQIMGAVEKGFFNRSVRMLQNLTNFFNKTSDAVKNASSSTDVIRAIAPRILPLWEALATMFHLVWENFSNIIRAFSHSQMLWGTVYVGIQLLNAALFLLIPLTDQLGGLLNIIIPLFIAYKAATWGAAIATGFAAFEEGILAKTTKDLTFLQFLLAVAMGRYQLMTKLSILFTELWTIAMIEWDIIGWTVAGTLAALKTQFLLLTAAMEINPFILLLTGLVLLVAGLVILYYKWDWFHHKVDQVYQDLIYWSPVIAAALTLAFGPLGVALTTILLIIRYWNQAKQIMRGDVGDALGIPRGHWYSQGAIGHSLGLPNWVTGYKAPHMAEGGTVMSPGLSWVGERGPELLALPTGAQVRPNSEVGGAYNLQESWMKNRGGDHKTLHVTLQVNRRVLGEVIAEEMAMQGARA